MQIRAAVLEQFGAPLEVQEVELAEPRAGEALVRLEACGDGANGVGPMHRRRRRRQGRDDPFISHELTLGEVNRGFELMEAQDGIRSVIHFGDRATS